MGHQRWHQEEENYAWASLIFGRPLLGQRVTDLLTVVKGLSGHEAVRGRRIVLAASGKLTVPALFAAAMEPAISKVYLASGLVSFRSIVESEEYDHPFANFVPQLLMHTDLPELAASLAPRRVRLGGTIDATGKRMAVESVQKIYGRAVNVEVSADAAWTTAAFLRL